VFYNQPLVYRFGNDLLGHILDEQWTRLEIGVAWVRQSGTKHVRNAIKSFLHRGGILRASVGIDIENTSKEGLQDLLSLCAEGDMEVFVSHNETRSSTFHPKVYLFSNDQKAKLIVGSNNITESGLFTNVEGGLEIDASPDEDAINEARMALASWRDPETRLAIKPKFQQAKQR